MIHQIQTFKPGTLEEWDDSTKFNLMCWNCAKQFIVLINITNMHYSIFKCTHCNEDCEIE